MSMIYDMFKHKPSEFQDNADAEIERLARSLEEKRQTAIAYLGDKWILKGGKYNRSNVCLGKK